MPSSIFPIVGDVVGNLVDTTENMNKDDDDDDDDNDDDDVAVVWCVSRVDDVTMNRDESDVDITDPDAVGKKIIHYLLLACHTIRYYRSRHSCY